MLETESSDICVGSHLIFVAETRKDKEFMVFNNRYACEQCQDYLSNEEIKICKKVNDRK